MSPNKGATFITLAPNLEQLELHKIGIKENFSGVISGCHIRGAQRTLFKPREPKRRNTFFSHLYW